MKALILNGSSRGIKGITHRLLQSFQNGLLVSNTEVTMFNLNELTIGHCKSCFNCMHYNPGVCSINDDMNKIYPGLKISDFFIIGTPLYTDNMSSLMKVFFDRCICSMQPFIYKDADNRYRHPYNWKMPKNFIIISTSGFPEKENFASLSKTIHAQSYNFGSELAAEFYIPGSIAFQMNLSLLEPYLKLLYEAGRAIGNNGLIPSDLMDRINNCVISSDEFWENYLKYEQWCKNINTTKAPKNIVD